MERIMNGNSALTENGLGKVHKVLARAFAIGREAGGFGDRLDGILEEMNGALAA